MSIAAADVSVATAKGFKDGAQPTQSSILAAPTVLMRWIANWRKSTMISIDGIVMTMDCRADSCQ